jgi:hypothetical protein
VYHEIKKNARPVEEVLSRFLLWCQQLVAVYEDAPDANGNIKIISDCPDFDLGRLHALTRLQTKTWPGPIRNLGGLKRHGQVDPCERLDALGQRAACEAWIKREFSGTVVHDHRPDNDSEHSYWQQVYMYRHCRQ